MSKQLKSILLSSVYFAVYVSMQLGSTLYFKDSIGLEQFGMVIVVPIGSFYAFWALRRRAKYKGQWHLVGTIWINSLMLGLSIWGISYFLLSGGASIPTVDPYNIWFRFSFSGALTATVFLIVELLMVLSEAALKRL